jgi:hypothetical protein
MQQHRTTPAAIVTPLGRRRVGLEPPPEAFALHLSCGRWEASCTTCGYLMVEAKRQDRCERKAQRVTCPICTRGEAAVMPRHPPDDPFIDLSGLTRQEREWRWQALRRRARRRLLALATIAAVATIAIVAAIRRWAG